MTIPGYRRLTIALSLVCVGLVVLSACLYWNHASTTIRVAFASEQTKIFEEMRTRALQTDATGAAACLEYVVGYYPSGTKQESGSRLDRIVEHERSIAVRDIVTHLRTKTGEDLGEKPDVWIKKYARK